MSIEDIEKLFNDLGITKEKWPEYSNIDEFSASLIESIILRNNDNNKRCENGFD